MNSQNLNGGAHGATDSPVRGQVVVTLDDQQRHGLDREPVRPG